MFLLFLVLGKDQVPTLKRITVVRTEAFACFSSHIISSVKLFFHQSCSKDKILLRFNRILLHFFLCVLAQGSLTKTAFSFLVSGIGLPVSSNNSFLKLEMPCTHQLGLEQIFFKMEVRIPSEVYSLIVFGLAAFPGHHLPTDIQLLVHMGKLARIITTTHMRVGTHTHTHTHSGLASTFLSQLSQYTCASYILACFWECSQKTHFP